METTSDEQIDAVFDYFDKDDNQKLETAELKTALQILGLDLLDSEIAQYQENDDESYDKSEFKALLVDRIGDIDFSTRIKESLDAFDPDRTGVVSRDKMLEILQSGDDPLSQEDAEEILDDFDVNKDGIFSIEELAAMLYAQRHQTDEQTTGTEEQA